MKIRDLMSEKVVRIDPSESVAVAARTLAHYNIGALPVCTGDGKLWGLVTDRDLVTRCMAAGRSAERTPVRDVMTAGLVTAKPDMEASVAASLMGARQIRRLPVLENGKLCGMISLGDLASNGDGGYDAADALAEISSNLSDRD